ncbi:GtrA family protein [Burkholderia sp. IMCC1007]|uniref:GtrA family protein n=1 Tax=Burkholderia sp. IMCC1007 TaxID=3004104 RepID=UPI0022B5577B|nr:GtrA family protein [Burkholderia sp. IMCC1007]
MPPHSASRVPPLPGKFLRFVLVGGICTLLNLSTLWFVTTHLRWHYLIAVTISFFTVNGVGFVFNKYFTFTRISPPNFREIRRYYFVMSSSLALNLGIMFIMVDMLGINYLLSSVAITLLFMIFNFLTHLGWTFAP